MKDYQEIDGVMYKRVPGETVTSCIGCDFYIKTVSSNPEEVHMLLALLLLAEDRVLSYAAVLMTKDLYYTMYEPSAVFYFEAETEILPAELV